jgi:uncharacterized protein DUF1877
VITHTIHAVSPAFLAACVRTPEILERWLGGDDSGIDPRRFAANRETRALAGPEGLGKVRSTDDGLELDGWLPALRWLLLRAFPDEPEAWAALDGDASEEFPVFRLRYGVGFSVPVARRLAGLLEVLPTVDVMKTYEPTALSADRIYPEVWSEPGMREHVEQAFYKLRRVFTRAARDEDAVLVTVTL